MKREQTDPPTPLTWWRRRKVRAAKILLLKLLDEQEQALLVQHLHADDYLACVSSQREATYREVMQGRASMSELQKLDRPLISTEERLHFITENLKKISREREIVNALL